MALVGSLTRLPPPVHWLSLQVDKDEATVVELLRGNIESKAVPKGAVDIGATEGDHFMSHLREAWQRPQWYSPAWWAAYVTGKAPVFRRALWEALKPWDATPELLLAAIEKATLAFEAAVAAVVAAGGRASDVLPGGGHIALRHGPRAMRKWWGANELRLLDLCGWMAPLAALVLSATPATPAAVELAVLASGRCLQSTRIKCGQADWYRTDDASSYNCVWLGLRFLLLAGVVVKADVRTTLVDAALRCGVQTGWTKPKPKPLLSRSCGGGSGGGGGGGGGGAETEVPVPEKRVQGSRTQALFKRIGEVRGGLFAWLAEHELQAANLLVFSIVVCLEVKMA